MYVYYMYILYIYIKHTKIYQTIEKNYIALHWLEDKYSIQRNTYLFLKAINKTT